MSQVAKETVDKEFQVPVFFFQLGVYIYLKLQIKRDLDTLFAYSVELYSNDMLAYACYSSKVPLLTSDSIICCPLAGGPSLGGQCCDQTMLQPCGTQPAHHPSVFPSHVRDTC